MDYTKEIEAIVKAGESVQLRVHKLLNTMAANWIKSGDVRPVVMGVNLLLEKFPKGLRSAALKKWVCSHFLFVMDEDETVFIHNPKNKVSALNPLKIKNDHWWDFKEPKAYVPIEDFEEMIARLVKKAETDRTKLGEKSVVDPTLLAALKAVKPVNTVPA